MTALDVAYGELSWRLRGDPRVTVIERFNARELHHGALPYAPDLIVADVSFISLRLVLGPMLACAAARFDALLLVKPQFEAGRERGRARGRRPRRRAAARRNGRRRSRCGCTGGVGARLLPVRTARAEGQHRDVRVLAEGGRGGVEDLEALALEADPE